MDVGWVCGNGGAMEVLKLLFDVDEKMNGRCNMKKNDFFIFAWIHLFSNISYSHIQSYHESTMYI